MGHAEPLETRTLLAASAWDNGWTLVVNLDDSDNVSIDVQDGRVTVTSDGTTVYDRSGSIIPGTPPVRQVTVNGNNRGTSIRLVSDYRLWGFWIVAGTGDDHVHVEGVEGAVFAGTIHGGNGADTFSLTNVRWTNVYGDNGDDLCSFTDATDSAFFGGNGDDALALVDATGTTFDGGRGEDVLAAA